MLDDVCPKGKNGVVEPVLSVDISPNIDCVFGCGSNAEVDFSDVVLLKVNGPLDGGPKACVEVVEPDVDCPLPAAPKPEVAGPGAFPTDVEGIEKVVEPNDDCWLPVAVVVDRKPLKDAADVEPAEPKAPPPPPPPPNPDGTEVAPNLTVLGGGALDVGAAVKAASAPSVAPALFSELLVSKESLGRVVGAIV